MRKVNKINPKTLKIAALISLFLGLITLIFIIPPSNVGIIFTAIILFSLIISLLNSFFLKRKYILLVSVSLFVFLTINYLIGFQLLTTVLLISFIIGVIILMKR
ncbi:MAG: hypothetical protein HYW86_02725 [Candidatus Roizmanbacteria bacterium]|nr:MAG: hypothetical protein HYW86_02725 [Candidatus Roizmanbacteria bacterium]